MTGPQGFLQPEPGFDYTIIRLGVPDIVTRAGLDPALVTGALRARDRHSD
jgi:hypothetical protein